LCRVRIFNPQGLSQKKNTMSAKSIFATAVVLIVILFFVPGSSKAEGTPNGWSNLEFEQSIKQKYAEMEGLFDLSMNQEILDLVKSYLYNHKGWTSALLGKSFVYFPIFESYLHKAGLPVELKYIAVLESSLRPKVKSKAGAVGLWQFMRSTAQIYGLQVNDKVDQRSDVYGSTEAAVKLLSNLYAQYNSWELALAAYNAGPGRVNKAIKMAGTDHYKEVFVHLPKETRSYLSKFQAVKFLMENYHEFGLSPHALPLDYLFVDTLRVYSRVDFQKLGEYLDFHPELLKELNPAYAKGQVPASKSGYLLVLPSRMTEGFDKKEALSSFLAAEGASSKSTGIFKGWSAQDYRANLDSLFAQHYILVEHKLSRGENIKSVARDYKVNEKYLRLWNGYAENSQIKTGTVLKVYFPKSYAVRQTMALPDILPLANAYPLQSDRERRIFKDRLYQLSEMEERTEVYLVRRGETIFQISEKLRVPVEEILQLNSMPEGDLVFPGMRITVSKSVKSQTLLTLGY
jgi:membrane-bound lytic murein transglycosylase D